MLCSIADVFDAMRSQRKYQAAQPTDRILEVLKYEDGAQFDRHLVRRFVQLVGIYPAGNLVRLNTGEIAVVTKAYAPDPHRPRVKVVLDRAGARLDFPYEVNLWELNEEGYANAIAAPLDSVDRRHRSAVAALIAAAIGVGSTGFFASAQGPAVRRAWPSCSSSIRCAPTTSTGFAATGPPA